MSLLQFNFIIHTKVISIIPKQILVKEHVAGLHYRLVCRDRLQFSKTKRLSLGLQAKLNDAATAKKMQSPARYIARCKSQFPSQCAPLFLTLIKRAPTGDADERQMTL